MIWGHVRSPTAEAIALAIQKAAETLREAQELQEAQEADGNSGAMSNQTSQVYVKCPQVSS